jgi:cytochrome c2
MPSEVDRRRRDRAAIAATAVVLLLIIGGYGGYRAKTESDQRRRHVAAITYGGDLERGRAAIQRYGCGGCHTITAIRNANGLVGPPLDGIANRVYIAGVALNTPDEMIAWIRDPHAIDAKTAMPNVGVTYEDARDITAFLYSLQ